MSQGVQTVPSARGSGWWNKLDGRVISRHRTKEAAVESGRATASLLGVPHSIQQADGDSGESGSAGPDPRASQDGE